MKNVWAPSCIPPQCTNLCLRKGRCCKPTDRGSAFVPVEPKHIHLRHTGSSSLQEGDFKETSSFSKGNLVLDASPGSWGSLAVSRGSFVHFHQENHTPTKSKASKLVFRGEMLRSLFLCPALVRSQEGFGLKYPISFPFPPQLWKDLG